MQQKLLTVLLMLLTVAVSQKQITMTCTTCAVSQCQLGFCVTLTGGTGQTETVCPNRACTTLNTPVTFNVNSCSLDYAGSQCSTGMCYYLAGRPVALLNQNNQCVNGQVRSYTCGTCIAVTGCASNLCEEYKIGGVRQSYYCVASCPAPINTQLTVSTCTEDTLFTAASCCMTFDQTLGAGGVCSTQSTIISSSSKLAGWVKGTTTFEYTLTTFLLFILVIVLNFMM